MWLLIADTHDFAGREVRSAGRIGHVRRGVVQVGPDVLGESPAILHIATHGRTDPPYAHLFCFVVLSSLFCGLYPLPLVVRTLPIVRR